MIDDFASILRAGILPGIGQSPASEDGFKGWLVHAAYVPTLVDDKTTALNRVNVEAFSKALSFDFERFCLSAQESFLVSTVEYERFKSIGWPLLKLYYSAFFSAHSIMRSRGAGVVKIERQQANYISQLLDIYSPGSRRFSPGVYFFALEKKAGDTVGEATVTFTPASDGKGVHEGFWEIFSSYMEDQAALAAAQQLPDHISFIKYASDLKEAIMTGGSGAAWFSELRNKINYQHKYEAWMPYNRRSQAYTAMPAGELTFPGSARLDFSKQKDPIKAFLAISCYISYLNSLLAEYIAGLSKSGGAFGQKWTRLLATVRT